MGQAEVVLWALSADIKITLQPSFISNVMKIMQSFLFIIKK